MGFFGFLRLGFLDCLHLANNYLGFPLMITFTFARYTTVNGSEMFYYFIESEGNPKKDPLLLWYSGGPGCSAFNGLIYENGTVFFILMAKFTYG